MQYFKVIGTTPIKFVIEMGLGVCIEEWYTLAQKLQDMGSVLLYERAGIGRSTESQYTRTPKVIAKELHDLMLYVKCEEKIIKLCFIREDRNNRAVITIKNTYLNKDVDVEKIFDKGESGKENHSGIGLWEVRNYIKKSKNLDLFTSKTDKFFKQELSIYDL